MDTHIQEKRSFKYELLLLCMAVIWGSAFVAQQVGMQKGIGPMTFTSLRFVLGGLILIPVMLWRNKVRVKDIPSDDKTPVFGSMLAGLFLFAAASFQQIGLQYTSCSNSGFITGLYILFVPLIGLLLGQKALRSLWVGVFICVVGLYLMSVTGDFTISKGDFLTLLSAVMWAAQILVIDRVAAKGDTILIAFIQFMVCAVLSGLAGLVFEKCTVSILIAGSGAVAYAGIMSVGIGFTLQVVCQKRCKPAPAAVIMSMEAVFAAIAGYILLNQTLTFRAIIGCCLILAGVLIVQLFPLIKNKGPSI